MKKQLISFDPEIIQFISDRQQLVKVTNLTQQTIDNCFFCMYNTQRYDFNPNYFSLEPHEQKLITVNFLSKLSPKQIKQFAYLKSSNLSKRITLINGPSTVSAQKFRSPQSGIEEIYTLSSRDYRETQISAYQKIIADKQAYIQRLQRINEELKDSSNRKSVREHSQQSDNKTKNFYLNQIEALQLKINLLNKEKQELIRQNILMQERFNEYKKFSASDSKYEQINEMLLQKNQLINRQNEQVQFLQQQCESFLSKLSEKQAEIQQIQCLKDEEIKQMAKKNQKMFQKLQEQLAKSKQNNSKASRIYDQRIKQLEQSVSQANTDRERVHQLEAQIQKKTKELQKIGKQLKHEKQQKNKYEQLANQSKINQKYKISLQKQKCELTSRIKQLAAELDSIKEQNILYKSKISQQDQSKSKMGHYLEVALQSCKNQNQILKANKRQLERQVSDSTRLKKNYENKIQTLQRRFEELTRELQSIKQEKEEIQSRNRSTKQEMHQALMKLKSENIDLIQKINVYGQSKQNEQRYIELENNLSAKNKQIEVIADQLQRAEVENEKLKKRIEKVRKETKREIKSIQEDTLEELKKVKGQKIKLTRKVVELEQSVNNSESYDMSRAKTKTHYDTPNQGVNTNARTRCPRSQGEKKLIGIKNQRKQLQQSRTSSNQQDIDLEGLYNELGQLRQFKSYVNNELEKLGKTVGVNYSEKQNINHNQSRNSIFRTINFFDDLKDQIKQGNSGIEKITELQKQNLFMKGRITQLEYHRKLNKDEQNRDIASSIEIDKQYSNNQHLIECIRKQMRTQYSKQYDALKLAEQKYNLLKKKIYEEYRSRIIGVLSKKNKEDVLFPKLEAILERFIDGLANLSHKQAVLAKQVKLKISARRQAEILRAKVKNLAQLLQMKKGYCTREPLNIFTCDNEPQWHDNIKLEAQILTLQSEMSKLKEELDLSTINGNYLQEELKMNLGQLQLREQQVIRLKKQIIKISKENEKQLAKRQDQLEAIQKKYIHSNHNDQDRKKNSQNTYKQSEFQAMKEDLQKKKQIIRNLKDKQKMLEQLLQSTQRNESANREKQRRQVYEQQRMENTLRDFKNSNRQLRTQNGQLREQINRLSQQLHHKNITLKRLRSQGEQHRIKNVKGQQSSLEKLRAEILQLKQQIKKGKQSFEKLKQKKQRQIQQLQSNLKRQRNEHIIEQKSFQSIIRALIDTIRQVYTKLEIIVKKKGIKTSEPPNFDELISFPGQIDSLKVYERFEKLIESFNS